MATDEPNKISGPLGNYRPLDKRYSPLYRKYFHFPTLALHLGLKASACLIALTAYVLIVHTAIPYYNYVCEWVCNISNSNIDSGSKINSSKFVPVLFEIIPSQDESGTSTNKEESGISSGNKTNLNEKKEPSSGNNNAAHGTNSKNEDLISCLLNIDRIFIAITVLTACYVIWSCETSPGKIVIGNEEVFCKTIILNLKKTAKDLDKLTLSMIVLTLSFTFVINIIDEDKKYDGSTILQRGAGIGIFITAIGMYLYLNRKRRVKDRKRK